MAALSSRFLEEAEDAAPLKCTVRSACAHRDLLTQEHAAGPAFLKYLHWFILIKNIYLRSEKAEACPGLH